MYKLRLVTLLFVLPSILWLGNSQLVSAQTQTTGAIRGIVSDPDNKDVIPRASVFIVNRDTGSKASSITNERGEYIFDLLRPGHYDLTAQCEGYVTVPEYSMITNLIVPLVDQTVITPPPLLLRRAGSTPTVPTPATGTPVAPPDASFKVLVNLEDASRSANFDERTLTSLPLAGFRSFDQLALLVAGVAPSPQSIGERVGPGVGPGVGTSGQFAVNGLRSRANNFTVDGSDNNDEDIGVRRQGFTSLIAQSIESVNGFRIATLLPGAQYGRNLGAQVDAVSRGGGRDFHGTLYGFVTDHRFNARNPFDLIGGQSSFPLTSNGRTVMVSELFVPAKPLIVSNQATGRDPYTRGQYGFVVSGPLTRKHTFFFGSFEHQDLNASQESHFAVPTVAERGLFGSGDRGLSVKLANNTTREAFPTSATGDAFYSLFPFPNNPRGPYGTNTYTEQLRANADGSIFSFRVDQNFKAFGKQHTFTSRYNFTDDDTTLPVTGEALFSSMRALVRTQNLSLFGSSTFTPRLANEARFSYGRTRLDFKEVRDPFLLPSDKLPNVPFLLNAPLLGNATLPSSANPQYSRQGNTEGATDPIGQVIVSGYSPIGVDVNNFPQRRVNNTFQFADTAKYNLLQHRLTFGVDLRRTQLNSTLERNFRSQALFTGSVDLAPRLGFNNQFSQNQNGFFKGIDFVAVGAPAGFIQTLSLRPDATIGLRYWQHNFFVADQIRLKKNLRLTLGLRYELNTVPGEVNDRIESTFTAPEVQKFIAEEKKRFNGVSGFENYLAGRRQIFNGDHNNFAPQLAFAWDPRGDGKTAVRGGYGIYYDQIPGAVTSQSRLVFPTFLTINLVGVPRDSNNEFLAFNPARLALLGSLNTFNSGLLGNGTNNLGNDFVDVILRLNSFATATLRNSFSPATPSFVLPAADLQTPYAQHWSLTVEHELWRDWLMSVAYVSTKGTHLLRFATPNYGPNAIPVVTAGLISGFEPKFQGIVVSPGKSNQRTYPLLGSFTSIESDANSSYHSFQAQLDKRFSHGWQLTTAYTWSHVIDEVSDLFDLAGARGLPQNSLNRSNERGDANFDLRHRFAQSFVWDVPLFSANKILGGWQLAGILTLQTGQPFTVTSGIDVNLDGNLTDRLNTTAGISEIDRGSQRFTFPAAQADQFKLLAVAGADGAVGRNTFRAPGVASFDLAVSKQFHLTEQQKVAFRVEFFNLFNRTHWGIPVHQLFSPGLGNAVSTTVPSRVIQFSLRFQF